MFSHCPLGTLGQRRVHPLGVRVSVYRPSVWVFAVCHYHCYCHLAGETALVLVLSDFELFFDEESDTPRVFAGEVDRCTAMARCPPHFESEPARFIYNRHPSPFAYSQPVSADLQLLIRPSAIFANACSRAAQKDVLIFLQGRAAETEPACSLA